MKNCLINLTVAFLFMIGNASSHSSVTFDVQSTFAFQTLQQKLKNTVKDSDCPYPYQRSGELCLYVANCAQSSSWSDARFFCQTYAGIKGDLVVFENACQYRDIITYLNAEVGDASTSACSFWAGANNDNTPPSWKFIDGSVLPTNGIYWVANPPVTTATQYAIFDMGNAYYMNTVDVATSEAPLCQYIPTRSDDDDDHHHHHHHHHSPSL